MPDFFMAVGIRPGQPAAYLKICALLVPKEMKLEHTNSVSSLSDEELDQAIAAIKAMLAAQAGEPANVIEGTADRRLGCRHTQRVAGLQTGKFAGYRIGDGQSGGTPTISQPGGRSPTSPMSALGPSPH